MSSLRADVFTAPSIPFVVPGGKPGLMADWSPTTATLISGEREAILVDALWTIQQANDLADWIEKTIPGKRLTAVYITHGHGDHFLGLKILRKRFPPFKTLATPRVIERIKKEIEPKYFRRAWNNLFPNQIDHDDILPDDIGANYSLSLEGHILQVHEAGDSDTTDTTFLHIPSLSLIVAGDIVYNDVHPFMGEAATTERRRGWLACLHQIAKLKPYIVIAGHKRDGAVDSRNNVEATIEYIETFEKLLSTTRNAKELFHHMSERYPTRINQQALLVSCRNAWSAKKNAVLTTAKI